MAERHSVRVRREQERDLQAIIERDRAAGIRSTRADQARELGCSVSTVRAILRRLRGHTGSGQLGDRAVEARVPAVLEARARLEAAGVYPSGVAIARDLSCPAYQIHVTLTHLRRTGRWPKSTIPKPRPAGPSKGRVDTSGEDLDIRARRDRISESWSESQRIRRYVGRVPADVATGIDHHHRTFTRKY